MACCTYCWLLMGLLGLSYEVSRPLNQMCTELFTNRSYSCEGLGLSELPEQLPFTTEVLDFSFNFLYSLQHSTFSKLKALVHLDLTRCQINWVYEGTFESNIYLETIIFTGNNLLFLATTAFTGPQCLKHLDLTQTGITKLTFIPMQDLHNIETLLLGSNFIQSLELPPDFPTRKLKYLDLQMNIIQTISTRDIKALKQANNLTLNLRGNKIMHIEPKAFTSFSVYSLDFGSCINISAILEGLQGISTVVLWLGTFLGADNSPIQHSTLQGICNISVDYLTLQYRTFLELSGDTFRCLSKLKRLDLTHTSLSELLSLPQMNLLKELNLNQNSFLSLCNIHSSAFPSLTHLYIQENHEAMDLGSGCLESLSKLQHLDLSRSHIESLDCCSNQLRGLNGLQHLNLSHNQKLSFYNTAFNECSNLKVLDLAFTHIITNNSQGPFHNLRSLQILNLSFSHIDTSKQNILQDLNSLLVLNMNGNSFESGTIFSDNFFQKAPNLEVLTLASCQLLSIEAKAFSALRKLKHVDLNHNNLIAFSSDVFSNLRNIYLNFANNRIHIIPHDLLTSLSGQSIINLSYNPLECTCSNIGLLTWYKQNIDKIEDSEETVCSEPKSLAGTKLFSINLSCGYSTAQIALIMLIVVIVIVVTFILIIYFLKQKYEHI
ncbi:CD180 antigen [Candoia aspera]|uniref:CD180 antigen n=1 Tax=Candoia aspera TaxID=51853 RepID=UPI002FD7EA78